MSGTHRPAGPYSASEEVPALLRSASHPLSNVGREQRQQFARQCHDVRFAKAAGPQLSINALGEYRNRPLIVFVAACIGQ